MTTMTEKYEVTNAQTGEVTLVEVENPQEAWHTCQRKTGWQFLYCERVIEEEETRINS